MRPRILIFSIAYEPLVGGAELAVRNITDRLSQYEFDLITCRFDRAVPKQEKIENVRVFRVGFDGRLGRLLYPVLAFRLAKRLHRETPYRLVWSIMAAYAGAAAMMLLRRFPKVKFLLTLQEGDAISHIHRRVRGFKKQWQAVFRRADRIQAISNFLADWARSEGATCPIDVVPNGVDLTKFQISNSKSQINSNPQITIITTSRLVPKNGIDILIRAVAELKPQIPNIKYQIQILGSGPEEKKLKRLASELKINDRIEFLGNVNPDEVPKYLSQADIFVRPSRSEGLGSSFLEAMAAGLPIVATKVGGIPEFLKDYETGLFVKMDDPADVAEKISKLLADKALRKTLGEKGQRLVQEKYSWDKVALQMDKIFSSLVAN